MHLYVVVTGVHRAGRKLSCVFYDFQDEFFLFQETSPFILKTFISLAETSPHYGGPPALVNVNQLQMSGCSTQCLYSNVLDQSLTHGLCGLPRGRTPGKFLEVVPICSNKSSTVGFRPSLHSHQDSAQTFWAMSLLGYVFLWASDLPLMPLARCVPS